MEVTFTLDLRNLDKFENNIAALEWAISKAPGLHLGPLVDTKHLLLAMRQDLVRRGMMPRRMGG